MEFQPLPVQNVVVLVLGCFLFTMVLVPSRVEGLTKGSQYFQLKQLIRQHFRALKLLKKDMKKVVQNKSIRLSSLLNYNNA